MTRPLNTQRLHALVNGVVAEVVLPAAHKEVLPGVAWGRADEFLSPAYWALQVRMDAEWEDAFGQARGACLWDSIMFCLLGGHGITYEMNQAAFEHLKASKVFERQQVHATIVEELLRIPLDLNGRKARYRFPRVKAACLAAAHVRLQREQDAPTTARALRQWLLQFDGIGPKTASWIVRNYFASDDVAILDVHVLRAGRLVGLFGADDSVQRHYFSMEDRFLAFARALGVSAARLDAIMWQQMRRSPTAVGAACKQRGMPFSV